MNDLTSDEAQRHGQRGIFVRLSPGGAAGSALSAGLGSIDAVFNPAAARAREELDQQHERVVAAPSPGDRIPEEGVIVIEVPDQREPGTYALRQVQPPASASAEV